LLYLIRRAPGISAPFGCLKRKSVLSFPRENGFEVDGDSAGRVRPPVQIFGFRLPSQNPRLQRLDFGLRVLGLTGGVGMGKSTAATLLAQRGVTIVDTDILARQIVEPGQSALDEIRQSFGTEMIASDGSLRRDQLARRVFSDSAARKKLEGILHPRIRQIWKSQLADWRAEPGSGAGVPGHRDHSGSQDPNMRYFCVVIPLLFETQAEREVDATLCVACSSAAQHQRLSSRGWNAEQINQRIKSQLPIEEKMARADYVIWNEGSVDVLASQLKRVLDSAASH
jgi:dephospho-CoA kinase